MVSLSERLLHPENALLPMDATELPKSTLARLAQPLNALAPIEVTELGMLTVVIFEPLTKDSGSTATSSPIKTCSILVFGMRLLSGQFIAFQINVLILLQLPKEA